MRDDSFKREFEQAWAKAKPSSPFGQSDLPGGIDNGRARLNVMKIDIYKSGQYQGKDCFVAEGIVIEPKEYEGKITRIMEPLCYTEKKDAGPNARRDLIDHIGWVKGELEKFGVDTSGLGSVDAVEAVLEALSKSKPQFYFSTKAGDPRPGQSRELVFHSWNGLCSPLGMEQEDEDYLNGVVTEATEPERKPETAKVSNQDLLDMIENGDEDAELELATRAQAAKVDIHAYETWTEVVEAMQSSATPIQVGDEVLYKGETYKVTSLFSKSGKANIQNENGGAKFSGVAVKSLIRV